MHDYIGFKDDLEIFLTVHTKITGATKLFITIFLDD